MNYSMDIRWSDEDRVFVVYLPEFNCYTHGETYLEAVKNGQEVLEMLVEDMTTHHETLPMPKRFDSSEIYQGKL